MITEKKTPPAPNGFSRRTESTQHARSSRGVGCASAGAVGRTVYSHNSASAAARGVRTLPSSIFLFYIFGAGETKRGILFFFFYIESQRGGTRRKERKSERRGGGGGGGGGYRREEIVVVACEHRATLR